MIKDIRQQHRIGRLIVALAMMLATSMTCVADSGNASRTDLINSLLPTVVNIAVRKEAASPPMMANAATPTANDAGSSKTFVGSGFIIDPAGLVVTNYHVVAGAYEITVTLSDGTTLPGKLQHASRLADLAVVQIQPPYTLHAAQWGDSNKLRVGDPVVAIGNPLGIGTSVSAGIVSGLNRDVQDSPYDRYIQTDAAINHGNSGGPLFDMEGRVIGVDTALISPTEGSVGLGLAIPSDSARFVVERLLKYGWVQPGWIGVKVQEVTREMADAMGSKQPRGSVVAWVLPASPASAAGIKIGDVVLKFGDDTPGDERALLRDIAHTPVGETVQVAVLRDGAELSLPVKVAAWPRNQWDERDAPMTADRPRLTIPPDLGLTLAPVAAAERAGLGLEEGLSGVLVSRVLPGSDAARNGMTDGDVILRVQDKPTATPGDVQTAISAARDQKHQFVMLLVLPKVRKTPGPSWVALRVREAGD